MANRGQTKSSQDPAYAHIALEHLLGYGKLNTAMGQESYQRKSKKK